MQNHIERLEELLKVHEDMGCDGECMQSQALTLAISILRKHQEAQKLLPEKEKQDYSYEDAMDSGNNGDVYSYATGEGRNSCLEQVTPIFAKLLAENEELKADLKDLRGNDGHK